MDVGVGSNRSGDDVAHYLARNHFVFLLKGIAQRVVLCKSFQLASVAIETTISHVCINEIFVGDDKTRKGCTHARMIAILMRFLVHFGVRLSNGFSEPLASFFNAGLIL